jgi:hypothetical protein
MTTAGTLMATNQPELERFQYWISDRRMLDRANYHTIDTFAVTGSQEWVQWPLVWHVLGFLPTNATMWHGKAYGLDCLAQAYWRQRCGEDMVKPWPANWAALKRRAGMVRNEIMMGAMPDLALAFIRNNSPGSSHAAAYARELGIPTFVFRAA